MRNKIKIFSVIIILLGGFDLKSTIVDPLMVTYNNGVANIGLPDSEAILLSYIQKENFVYSPDTVLSFNRSAGTNSTGVKWSGNGFSSGKTATIGGANSAIQYKYLVVNAKQCSNNNFGVKLEQITPLMDGLTIGPIYKTGVANKWNNYIFDLSTAVNAGNSFNKLSLYPDFGFVPATSLINKIFFTNNTIVTQKPAISMFSRTANSVDLYWVATPGASSYRIIDSETGNIVKDVIVGLSTTLSGLKSNTLYSFNLVALNNEIESIPSVNFSITTRKSTINYEVIEDYEEGAPLDWFAAYGSTINAVAVNTLISGINLSAKSAMINVAATDTYYGGIQTNKEKIVIGPNLPYRYLHIKMKRNGGTGDFGVQLQPTSSSTNGIKYNIAYASNPKMSDGLWHDYVFDLTLPSGFAGSGNISTEQIMNNLIIKCNIKNENLTINTQIDDLYLSNDPTPSNSNLTTDATILLTSDTGGSVFGSGIYATGQNISISAIPKEGFHFVNWTEDNIEVSKNASFNFSVLDNRTLKANFDFDIVPFSYNNSDSLMITFNNGIDDKGLPGAFCTATYIQYPINAETNDTVMEFQRSISAYTWQGVRWSGSALNDSKGIWTGTPSLVPKINSTKVSEILGICHVEGNYHFTDEPFLIEGAKEILKLGSKNIKLWFEDLNDTYYYNSSWPGNITSYTYTQRAQTPYFKEVFNMPFKVYSLEITNKTINWKDGLSLSEKTSLYNNMYDLTKYLLSTYKNTGKTFILQNWEGDGHLSPGDLTTQQIPIAVQGMIDWTNARQDAVTQAQKDVGMEGVLVVNAFEFSSVLSFSRPGPYTIDAVVPYTHCDIYSYSCYTSRSLDSLGTVTKRLEYAKTKIPPSTIYGNKNFMIGEFGYEERGPWPYTKVINNTSGQRQLQSIQSQLNSFLNSGVQYVFCWQIYCNGRIDKNGNPISKPSYIDMPSDSLMGYWLRRPDGSYTPTYNYFKTLYESDFNQYQYLIVKAKQNTSAPFKVALQQTVLNPVYKTDEISSKNQAVANQWQDYVFDLSKGITPDVYFQLMLMPEYGNNTNAKTLIDKVYLTNDNKYLSSLTTNLPNILDKSVESNSIQFENNTIIFKQEFTSFEIYDLMGKLIKKDYNLPANSIIYLNRGMYILILNDFGHTSAHKILIK